MASVTCKARKWGNSVGIVLPADFVEREGIQPDQEINIEINKFPKAKQFAGLLKGWKIDPQKAKDEMRKGWG